MVSRFYSFLILLLAVVHIAGCGYTTRSLLPTNYKTIYIGTLFNSIQVTAEQSNQRMYRGYRPGLEIDVTKAIIDRFIFDGNLRIGTSENADIILKGALVDYRKEPLRYDANDNIEEYRIKIVVDIELIDTAEDKVVWREPGFSGETTYRTGGSLAKGESAAVRDAIEDLARRVVERTVEGW